MNKSTDMRSTITSLTISNPSSLANIRQPFNPIIENSSSEDKNQKFRRRGIKRSTTEKIISFIKTAKHRCRDTDELSDKPA